MRKLLIITLLVLLLATVSIVLITLIGESKLSDETLETVEDLRWKHYGIRTDYVRFYDAGAIQWNRDFLSIWVEDGKLFVETQDGKWFIEMEKIKEE